MILYKLKRKRHLLKQLTVQGDPPRLRRDVRGELYRQLRISGKRNNHPRNNAGHDKLNQLLRQNKENNNHKVHLKRLDHHLVIEFTIIQNIAKPSQMKQGWSRLFSALLIMKTENLPEVAVLREVSLTFSKSLLFETKNVFGESFFPS